MRAVVDTNVLISGLLWQGPPHDLLVAARDGDLALITSPAMLGELAQVLDRPKFTRLLASAGVDAAALAADIRLLADVHEPPPLPVPVCRDADDDAVLALAVAADADCIVSGDDDLLTLGGYAGIEIISARRALAKVKDPASPNLKLGGRQAS